MSTSFNLKHLAVFAVIAALPALMPAQQSSTPADLRSVVPAPNSAPQLSDPAQATPVASKSIVPSEPATPEQMGDALMAHQRYQAAIEAYRKGAVDSPDIWNKMGIAYQLMFNLDEAERCYEKSLKLDPKNAVTWNNMGTVEDSQKEYSTAEHMYHKALKLDPKSALINKNLGTNLLAQHKYKKGWEYYKLALTYDPQIFQHSTSPRIENPASVEDRGAMNYYMAKGCVRAGMNDKAIEYLRMALNEGFTNPKKVMADSEFAALHDLPEFQRLMAAQGTPQ
jgi:tetratricopeptide (TPR) repeat protein